MKFIQSWWDINKKGCLSENEIKLVELSRMTFEYNLDTNITFYTDLTDISGLNYSDVKPLEVINQPKEIWCLGKLVAMAQQTEPFIHVDTDMFLWKKTSHEKFRHPFVVFHHEHWLQSFMDFAKKIPAPLSLKNDYDIFGSNNFGLIGGMEWKAITETAQEILDHVKKYKEEIISIASEYETGPKMMWCPVLIEQVWMSEILIKKGINPNSFLKDKGKKFNRRFQSNLTLKADKLGIAHYWTDTKSKYQDELVDAYYKWKSFIDKQK